MEDLYNCRARRRVRRDARNDRINSIGLNENATPAVVNTHHRNVIITPRMVGCTLGVHNGKTFVPVEIKTNMIGHYSGEFSLNYKPVKHGRPGIRSF